MFENKCFMHLYGQTDFATRSNKDNFRFTIRRIGQHIRAARYARSRCILFAIQCRQRLARQNQDCRTMTQLHNGAIRFNNFICIARTKQCQTRNCAQRSQVFYWLVRRAIFTQSDGVMCHDIDDALVLEIAPEVRVKLDKNAVSAPLTRAEPANGNAKAAND